MDYRFSLQSVVLPHVTRNVAQNTRPCSTFLGTSQYCVTWLLTLLTPCRCIFVLIPAAEHMHLTTLTHWTSLPLSHDLQTLPPTTTWQHATSHAPVECQIWITFLFPLQSPSCFPQPKSQCPLWSGESDSGNHSTVANHEWGHWNQPRTCWWVFRFVALSLMWSSVFSWMISLVPWIH